MWSLLGRFICDRQAATAIEYGLIIALIASVMVYGLDDSGVGVNKIMTKLNQSLAPAAR